MSRLLIFFASTCPSWFHSMRSVVVSSPRICADFVVMFVSSMLCVVMSSWNFFSLASLRMKFIRAFIPVVCWWFSGSSMRTMEGVDSKR